MRYQYQCDVCDHRLTIWSRGGPPDRPACPTCGGPVRRIWTAPQVVVYHDATEYVNRAIDGREKVPGMTREQVEAVARTIETKPAIRRRNFW